LFCFILLEFFVFRFVLVASDFPKLDFVDGVLKYEPEQDGIYRVKNEVKGKFKINESGWNSKYDQYEINRSGSKLRVAVIGDSYVEALHVNYDESLAEQIELAFDSGRLEAYRFAVSGAPLSQYLHILRKETLKYSPDLVVIIVVHNDFDESYLSTPGVYTRSFLKIRIVNGAVEGEVSPVEYERPWYAFIRNSATWRYLAYRQQIRFSSLRNLFFRKQKQERHTYQANIEVSGLDTKMARNQLVTEYIFKEMRELCKRNNAQLLIVMDGERDGIYKSVDHVSAKPRSPLRLNRMAKSVAEEYHIDFIDLQPVFQKDFTINRKSFDFSCDSHWNTYGHKVVANTIAGFIKSNLLASRM
jgi:DNA polymerase III epsilon subunit-like protein